MKAIRIKPAAVSGTISASASKSDAQRAIAAAALARGESSIERFTPCADSLAALSIVQSLGAEVSQEEGKLIIRSGRLNPASRLDCGESGLCLRLFAPIAALHSQPVTLFARGSLLARPVDMVAHALRQLGVSAQTRNGFPPIRVHGPLQGGKALVEGKTSSQHVSGLLFALPLVEADSQVTVDTPSSKPYIRMTLATLSRFGIVIKNDESLGNFFIRGNQAYVPCQYAIEGDWSGAAFMLVAGAMAGSVSILNLNPDSQQADRAVMDVLRLCGADVKAGVPITVGKKNLHPFEFDAGDAPDLFPPLVALASLCSGTSRIWGSGRLKSKESDRAAALVAEFTKLGARIRENGNCLEISGGRLKGGSVYTHNDHRIAMAAAVAGLASEEGVCLDRAGCVAKSYPGFFTDLKKLCQPS